MIKLETKLVRSFDEWWDTLPDNFGKKPRKGGSKNTPFLNQINYILVHNNLQGNCHLNPTLEELRHWISSGQVDAAKKPA